MLIKLPRKLSKDCHDEGANLISCQIHKIKLTRREK